VVSPRIPSGISSALSIGLIGLTLPHMAAGRTLVANPQASQGQPNYYRSLAGSLAAGDTLMLPSGVYREGLDIDGLQGTPTAWIVITGPSSGPAATITTESSCCNTVQLGGNAYVAIRNLTIDSAMLPAIDGINAKGSPTHDILIEGCTLIGQTADQATIGISTKSPAWRWTIRGNRILEAGTGLYLGNSDGTQPFIAGVIEGNLIMNSIGYNMQIKHQVPYQSLSWASLIPPGPHRTVIRNNVFIKERNDWTPDQSPEPRPNLLVDPFPDTGMGSTDLYEIYGNFFYKNPIEALFQGTGRIALHDNVFLASGAGQVAASFTDHNGPLKLAHVYNNTIYSVSGGGIYFVSSAREGDAVVGNLIVTGEAGLGGSIASATGNVLAPVADAAQYFTAPSEVLGQVDLYPKAGCPTCNGTPLTMTPFQGHTDYDKDFNGTSKAGFTYRGAYAGEGVNPGWRLQAGLKSSGPQSQDTTPPAPPQNLRHP
jgi:hypothetical protein